jgi:hypothetical protein
MKMGYLPKFAGPREEELLASISTPSVLSFFSAERQIEPPSGPLRDWPWYRRRLLPRVIGVRVPEVTGMKFSAIFRHPGILISGRRCR